MATMTSSAQDTYKQDGATNTPAQLNPMNNSSAQGITPLSPDAMKQPVQVTDTTQGNNQVLKTAQETALNQNKSPLSGLVQQRTAQYLQDPNLGYDYNAYNQNQMDQFNADQSKSMEAARQQLGNTSQSGELQNEFLKNALTVSQNRANLQSKLAQDQQTAEQKNYLNALAQGREGMTAQEEETTSQIGNLSTARTMGEGEREQTSTQTYNTSERLSTQDFESMMADKNMTHDEKMANINAAIAEAKAGKDYEREKDLMGVKAKYDIDQLYAQGDIDKAKITLQGDIQKALNEGDHVAAEALQRAGFVQQSIENAKDRALKQYEDDLTQQGINISALREAVDSGRISAEAYFKALQNIGNELGVAVTAPDLNQINKQATDDFKTTQIQWGLSHPEMLVNPQDPTQGLTAAGATAFNEFYNQTLYNDEEYGSSQYKPIYWNNNSSSTNDKSFAVTPPAIGSYIKMPNGTTYKVTSDVVGDGTPSGGGRLQFTAINTKTGQTETIKAGK